MGVYLQESNAACGEKPLHPLSARGMPALKEE